jgi:arylsulfatase A-like enzyme
MRPALAALAALLTTACATDKGDDTAPVGPVPGAVCPDTLGPFDTSALPDTVLVISIDTVNEHFLGVHHEEWDTTPTLDALMAEGTRFDGVVVPRGLSAPSMASLLTGAWPATHGMRANEAPEEGGSGIDPATPPLYTRFEEAGYQTWGWSANMCFLLDHEPPIQSRSCQWQEEVDVDQAEGDRILAEEAAAVFAGLPPGERVFGWLHLMDPHDPYERRDPWYEEFHPEAYAGAFLDPTEDLLVAASQGEIAFDDADRRHVEAVYASQLRQTDANIATVLAGLEASGRLDDAVILIGFDHGEELARRDGYFFHGCSVYQEVLGGTWALRAPGRVPAGVVLEGTISSTDLAPTLIEAAGLDWSGAGEGVSALTEAQTCVEPARSAYFERGNETAGVVREGWSFILDPREGYTKCKHYDGERPYPGVRESLFDLANDPLELDNVVEERAGLAADLRADVCAWVASVPWTVDTDNAVEVACR